jgi:hypothetical protein
MNTLNKGRQSKGEARKWACRSAFLAALFCAATPGAFAAFVNEYALSNFSLSNLNADGSVSLLPGGSLVITGGNNGSGLFGVTDVTIVSASAGAVSFDYAYSSLDFPGFDFAAYLLGGPSAYNTSTSFTQFADSDGMAGSISFPVNQGQVFGFRVATDDNTNEPGIVTISNFVAPASAVPEPGTFPMIVGGAVLLVFGRIKPATFRLRRSAVGRVCLISLAAGVFMSAQLFGQPQSSYTGSNITGKMTLSRVVNALQLAQPTVTAGASALYPELTPKAPAKHTHPPVSLSLRALSSSSAVSLPVNLSSGFGFNGLSHLEQRQANNGNQFSVEPPSPSIAVGNGFVLEGVNNAFRVYNVSGSPLLQKVLSTNELFGLPPAIDRVTGINGVYPTDMRVFFDGSIQRWFILQRAQDNDIFGNPLDQSHLYLAVSQSADPTGNYYIYTMDTTDSENPGCPCVADYPQIGADQYGFYISSNEFNTFSAQFVNAAILGISKTSLAAGASSPGLFRFVLPLATGFEFAIQPATTPAFPAAPSQPAGASYFLASGGVEFFVSSQASSSVDNNLAVWAMGNTGSLGSGSPNLSLTRTTVPVLTYTFPDVATQRPGPLPYGSSLFPPGTLSFLDGGDPRVLSVSYSGGRIYATLATQVRDESGRLLVGGAYVIMSPSLRSGVLMSSVLRQGYLMVSNNHVLRPSIAVNAQGRGAIAFTLSGPDYYPSLAFVPIDTFSTGAAVQVAAPGALPEDGFTGYPGGFGPGVARWGDYSAAVISNDGSVWMTAEYIPNTVRTEFANWGTFLTRYIQ